jgi:pyruvate ferredoxin oxidoreductase alpha subunit
LKKPKTFGPIAFPDSFMEFKKAQQNAMEDSIAVIEKTNSDFAKAFGRKYGNGLVETYKIEDAQFAIAGMGTLCSTAHVAIDNMRKRGIKAGLIKIKSLRPWPAKAIEKAAKGLEGIAVIDRHVSLGFEGPLATDMRSSVYCADVRINDYISGLGGRDITLKHLEKAIIDLKDKKTGSWLL